MAKSTTVSSRGIGFCGLLAIAFIVLKLAKIGAVAEWSWWWVLSPLWIPPLVLLVIGIAALAVVIALRTR